MKTENKEIELKLYFSDIEHILAFLESQTLFQGLDGLWKQMMHCGPEYAKFEELFETFKRKYIARTEQVNNMILCLESYLSTRERIKEEMKNNLAKELKKELIGDLESETKV
jgi:hypothetical protein